MAKIANLAQVGHVELMISQPRISTYKAAAPSPAEAALNLYGWNACMSAALMMPAHFVEVLVRNAVDDALAAVYGPMWPWKAGFERSLPRPKKGFNPHSTLRQKRAHHGTTGKVIAELPFAFWQAMFTASHDNRIWNSRIHALFPNSAGGSPQVLRKRIHDDLERIRQLRNRCAHHEPIFRRDLQADFNSMIDLVELRSQPTVAWVKAMEDVSSLLADRP